MYISGYEVKVVESVGGGFVIFVPDLDCASQGDTLEEAIEMTKDCIEGQLEVIERMKNK